MLSLEPNLLNCGNGVEWPTYALPFLPSLFPRDPLRGPARSQNFGPSNGSDCVQQKKELSVHFAFIGTKSAEFWEQSLGQRTTEGFEKDDGLFMTAADRKWRSHSFRTYRKLVRRLLFIFPHPYVVQPVPKILALPMEAIVPNRRKHWACI